MASFLGASGQSKHLSVPLIRPSAPSSAHSPAFDYRPVDANPHHSPRTSTSTQFHHHHRSETKPPLFRRVLVGLTFLVLIVAWLGGLGFVVWLRVELMPPKFSSSKGFSDDFHSGIVWFGKGNTMGEKYDPAKRTLLFCHDRLKNSVQSRHLPSFNAMSSEPKFGLDSNLADAWIDDGWNVGLFFWDQLADESNMWDAETKIWTSAGEAGLRWLTSDGRWHLNNKFNTSVSEFFADSVLKEMSIFSGEFRVVGHGVGAQIAAAGTQKLFQFQHKNPNATVPLPQRLALIDPYYSDATSSAMPLSTSRRLAAILHQLQDSVVVEVYKCSVYQSLFGGTTSQLYLDSVEAELHLGYIQSFQVKARHNACPNHYFGSYNELEPPVEISADGQSNGHIAPCSRLSTQLLLTKRKYTVDSKPPVWIQQGSVGAAVWESSDSRYQVSAASKLQSPALQQTTISVLVIVVCILEGLLTLFFAVLGHRKLRKRLMVVETGIAFHE